MEIINSIDDSISIYDATGKKIIGSAGTKDERFPIRLDGETIAWISGGKASHIIANILSHLAEKERDIKCLAEETLNKYKELTMLYALNEKMAMSLELEKIGHVIIAEAVKMIKADNASIMLMDKNKGVLRILSALGKEYNPKVELKPDEGIAGYIFNSGKAEIVNKVESDKRFVAGANRIYSIMCAPLKVKDKILGVINISSEKPYDYTASDLKFFTALASQAASAIEIAHLYDAEKRQKEMLERENINLTYNLRQKFSPARILGTSRQIRDILDKVEKIADIPINVLITGETGTGKELIAKAIHYNSSRFGKPFVVVNCSAVPEPIFESEMFGIEKGVATGVDKRMGKIEQANGGTLFLDEIGDMPLSCQAKMLRIIESQQLERLGSRESIPLNIRVIAATNKDLKKEVENGNFREDLFYRLNVMNFHIPPLRERREDIPLLINYFLDNCTRKFCKQQIRFSADAIKLLMQYNWPGNVRELENEIERAVALCVSDVVTIYDLSDNIRNQSKSAFMETEALLIDKSEKAIINKALIEAKGNKSKAAKALGISREGLRKKMKRFGLK
ncbi:sigma-54-dependent Fis family transcriptional regulator [hot springs metagenome]|uniref:Sigma-54-dependent Fis family transcriptional regulator n=1 Tax=hot springs metagenome TaxID=433727 RepID=A0A5J4L310_9ZZZZ